MEYKNLGRTGLKVSRLCPGTMNFGWHTTRKDSFALMDKALELKLSDDGLRKLDEIWPDSGGEAPAAYAW